MTRILVMFAVEVVQIMVMTIHVVIDSCDDDDEDGDIGDDTYNAVSDENDSCSDGVDNDDDDYDYLDNDGDGGIILMIMMGSDMTMMCSLSRNQQFYSSPHNYT
ncbi:hypothetical protein ElyMa_003317600 [Elysia marginata]|uniref:Uncharacterized protein n=1 Tax=Elysia marginata TaxID=1093978 RepID=A0AAV4JF01_9GAST|nr:hypothetical protein ElyMa_003317600 [Elysia marginata]